MAQTLFLFTILALHLYTLLPSTSVERQGALTTEAYDARQNDYAPLSLNKIEAMLKNNDTDERISVDILKYGIDFRVDTATLDRLTKQGAGPRTRQALEQKEENAAYTEFANEKNPERRLTLGNAFARNYPNNPATPRVTAELRKVELENFELAFRIYSDAPSASGLKRLLAQGNELLDRRTDTETALCVRPRLAIAAGKGMRNSFYSDLEQSREYANAALRLLENPTPAPDVDAKNFNELRASSLSLIYQYLGLYYQQQNTPQMEQSIDFLTKAAEMKDSPAANDPATYWWRALARQDIYQNLCDEFRALSKAQRVSKQGQSICARISTLYNQLNVDYQRVFILGGRVHASQLVNEAQEAQSLLINGSNPCLSGRGGLIDEWPSEEKRYALVIGVENYSQDKQVARLNYAASDARAVADALTRYGGFKKEQVVLLTTDEPNGRQPVRSAILQQLRQAPNRVKEDGLLLIYFVGHGFEKAGQTYLLAADSITSDESLLSETAISLERFKELVLASGAGQVMLIFDAFRQTPVSETFSRRLSFDTRKNEVTAFATLLSTSVGQLAYESQARKQGHFTSAFLDAVKGKALTKKRGVTLDDLTRYLQAHVPQEALRESGTSARQSPMAFVEGYESEDLEMFFPTIGGQTTSQAAKSTPAELIRSSKSIAVRSKTVYMNHAVLQAELSKLPEFKAWDLKIVNDEKEADLVIEVRLPALTWMWNYTIIHRPSNTNLTSGKERGLTDDSVSPRLATKIIAGIKDLRDTPQK
jgi:hypothetical protein